MRTKLLSVSFFMLNSPVNIRYYSLLYSLYLMKYILSVKNNISYILFIEDCDITKKAFSSIHLELWGWIVYNIYRSFQEVWEWVYLSIREMQALQKH